jgi:hypothetical protein
VEGKRLDDWTFSVEEVSAGAYRGKGLDSAGRSVESSGTDPDALLEKLKEWAAEIVGRSE